MTLRSSQLNFKWDFLIRPTHLDFTLLFWFVNKVPGNINQQKDAMKFMIVHTYIYYLFEGVQKLAVKLVCFRQACIMNK